MVSEISLDNVAVLAFGSIVDGCLELVGSHEYGHVAHAAAALGTPFVIGESLCQVIEIGASFKLCEQGVGHMVDVFGGLDAARFGQHYMVGLHLLLHAVVSLVHQFVNVSGVHGVGGTQFHQVARIFVAESLGGVYAGFQGVGHFHLVELEHLGILLDGLGLKLLVGVLVIEVLKLGAGYIPAGDPHDNGVFLGRESSGHCSGHGERQKDFLVHVCKL